MQSAGLRGTRNHVDNPCEIPVRSGEADLETEIWNKPYPAVALWSATRPKMNMTHFDDIWWWCYSKPAWFQLPNITWPVWVWFFECQWIQSLVYDCRRLSFHPWHNLWYVSTLRMVSKQSKAGLHPDNLIFWHWNNPPCCLKLLHSRSQTCQQ